MTRYIAIKNVKRMQNNSEMQEASSAFDFY